MTIDAGAQCPRCRMPLILETVRSGNMICTYCRGAFEATVFSPPQRVQEIVQIATAGPEGANACANHAGNAAVTSCKRCGLFICGLCEMNVGTGSYCPTCFDRVRDEGSLQEALPKYRDYSSMAWSSVILGFPASLMFMGLPFGAMALYWASKGAKQRRKLGEPTLGMIVAAILGVLLIAGGLGTIAFFVWAVVTTS